MVTAPQHKGLDLTVVAVCVTVVALFIIAGMFYLDVRNQSSMALTQLSVNVLAALPGLLAYISAKRAQAGVEVVAQHTNGHLAHQTEVANLALAELPADKAAKVVETAHANAADVAGTSPTDEHRT